MINSKGNYLSIEDFMNLAADFEQDSAQFYRNMQNLDLDDSAMQLAVMLEKQELKHKEIIQNFDISGMSGIIQFPPEFSLSLPDEINDDADLEELTDVAIAREVKSKEIYENALMFVSGDLKKLIESLMQFEEDHIYRLKSLKDNL